jgi:L-fuculose-phosphate aldolase
MTLREVSLEEDDPRLRIAASRRMLAREGCESMVAGHVSERAAGEDAFWISPFEYFDETLPERIIKISFDLTVLAGSWEPSPAVQFHAAIYAERPEVGAIVHTHSQHISALVTRDEPVRPYNITAALFVGTQATYVEDGLQPPVEGKSVAAALGDNDALLISNHGVILTGATLEHAAMRAVLIEQAARFQLEAIAAGGTMLSANDLPRRADFYRNFAISLMWQANLRRLRQTDADLFAAS